jgi:hypothetical protein
MGIEVTNCTRSLRLKVKGEAYGWLNAAAVEVNQVWNYANATSDKAARPFSGPAKWLSAYDLDKLTAGATECFERIGSETITAYTYRRTARADPGSRRASARSRRAARGSGEHGHRGRRGEMRPPRPAAFGLHV